MTTLIEDIQAVLNPLTVGGAWYAVNTAEPPTYPYIVWQRIVSTTNNTFEGASNLQNTRIQVDVFAQKVSDLDTASKAVIAAIAAAPFKSLQLSSQDLYEEPVRAFRSSIDFSVWATN